MSLPKPVSMPEEFPDRLRDSMILVGGAVLVGAATGFLGVAFLKMLQLGNAWRMELTGLLKSWPAGTGLAALVVGTGLCAAFAAWLVNRFAPNAAGSGIPYVEKILRGPGHPEHSFVLTVKFFGGFIAAHGRRRRGRSRHRLQRARGRNAVHPRGGFS